MIYEFEFIVEGIGEFPIDMLRHEKCYPKGSADAQLISQTLQQPGLKEPVRIRLSCWKGTKTWTPTLGRWNSSLWSVVQSSGPIRERGMSKIARLEYRLGRYRAELERLIREWDGDDANMNTDDSSLG